MNVAYKVLYALAVWPVALILAVIGAWWPLGLGVMDGDVVSSGLGGSVRLAGWPVVVAGRWCGEVCHAGGRLAWAWPG